MESKNQMVDNGRTSLADHNTGYAAMPAWLEAARESIRTSPEWLDMQAAMQQMVRSKLLQDGISVLGDLTETERASYVRQVAREAVDTSEYGAFVSLLRNTTETHLSTAAASRAAEAQRLSLTRQAREEEVDKHNDGSDQDQKHDRSDSASDGGGRVGVSRESASEPSVILPPRDVVTESHALEELAESLAAMVAHPGNKFHVKSAELTPLIGGHLPPLLRTAVWRLFAQKAPGDFEAKRRTDVRSDVAGGSVETSAYAKSTARPITAQGPSTTAVSGAGTVGGHLQMEILLADMNLNILQQFRLLIADSPSRILASYTAAGSNEEAVTVDTPTLTLAKTLLSVSFADIKALQASSAGSVSSTLLLLPNASSQGDPEEYDAGSPRAVASYYWICPFLSVFGSIDSRSSHSSTISAGNVSIAVAVMRVARAMQTAFISRFMPSHSDTGEALSNLMGQSVRSVRDRNIAASVLSLLQATDTEYAAEIKATFKKSSHATAYLDSWLGHCLDTGFVGRVSFDTALYVWDSLLLSEFESFVPMAVAYLLLLKPKLVNVLSRVGAPSVALLQRTALLPSDLADRMDVDRIRTAAAAQSSAADHTHSDDDADESQPHADDKDNGATRARADWRAPSQLSQASNVSERETSSALTRLLQEPRLALQVATQPHLPKLRVQASVFQRVVSEYNLLELAHLRKAPVPPFLG